MLMSRGVAGLGSQRCGASYPSSLQAVIMGERTHEQVGLEIENLLHMWS